MGWVAATGTLACAFVSGCFEEGEPRAPGPPSFVTGGSSSTTFGTGTSVASTTTSSTVTGGFDPTRDGGNGWYTGPVIVATTPPPAVSGGTLAILAGGHIAAVADSDRDQVVLVDLDALAVTATIRLQKGDEPGRIVEDGAGRLHVALRGGEAIADLDAVGATLLARRHVCEHPRGLAYEGKSDKLHVACVGGELVSLPAAGGDATRRLVLDRDLRDVVVDGDRLLVSRFRAAELLVVEPDGSVSARVKPPAAVTSIEPPGVVTFSPAVAWRTIAAPGGGALMVLQEERSLPISVTGPAAYGSGGCDRIVKSTVSLIRLDGGESVSKNVNVVLPVDVVSKSGGSATIVGAGISLPGVRPSNATQVVEVVIPPPPTVPPADAGPDAAGPDAAGLDAAGSDAAGIDVHPSPPPRPDPCRSFEGTSRWTSPNVGEQAVAVAYGAGDKLVVQTRAPALWVDGHRIILPGALAEDTGHALFHLAAFSGLACASCHPEGREDGHVWSFSSGKRRTQTIGGGIRGTEPFHWSGEIRDFDALAHEVFINRMSGPVLAPEHVAALANWIETIPPWKPPAPADGLAAERGRVLFVDPAVGCSTCHAGTHLTTNATLDVGTRGLFQVPSLRGVGFRAPFLHDGCAATLVDRFGPCGGDERHGHTSSLSVSQQADLAAYLETL
jgi:hypothetical protein